MSDFTLAAAMTLDNRRFLGPMRQSRSATRSAVGGLRSLIAPLATLTAGYLSLRGAVSLANGVLSGAGGAERSRATLEVLLGSAEEAKKVFEELTEFSMEKALDPKATRSAAVNLLAAKFEARDLKTLLADAGNLASVTGVNLMEVTRVFGRLNSGDFGESFERLRDFGISRPDLEGEGLVFDRGGSYQGSIEKAMTAVRNIIRERFSGTMEAAAKTFDGKVQQIRNGWAEVKRELGEPLIDALKPILDYGYGRLKAMKDEAAAVGRSIADVMKLIIALGESGGLGDALSLQGTIAAADFVNTVAAGLKTAFIGGLTILRNGLDDMWTVTKITFKQIGLSLAETILKALADALDAIPGLNGNVTRARARNMSARRLGAEREERLFKEDPDRWNFLRDPVLPEVDLGKELIDTSGLRGALEDMLAPLRDLLATAPLEELLSPFRANLATPAPDDEDGRPGTPGDPARSVRAITADRLQRIGGFVGGMSPERRSADRTAKATEESAKRLKAIESKLQPSGGLTPAALWA